MGQPAPLPLQAQGTGPGAEWGPRQKEGPSLGSNPSPWVHTPPPPVGRGPARPPHGQTVPVSEFSPYGSPSPGPWDLAPVPALWAGTAASHLTPG